MNDAQFADSLGAQLAAAPTLPLEPDTRIVVMSDFHAGNGSSRDDLSRNGRLLLAALEHHYLVHGSILVLNGDIEELQKYRYQAVRRAWPELFALFDRFAREGRLYKIAGNHDERILADPEYPYPTISALKLAAEGRAIYVFHGHQASHYYTNYNALIGALVKLVVRGLGIHSPSVSKDSRRRFKVERRIYRYCQERRLVAIIGHTHRPLFESLSKYDALRFGIERLCREYPSATARRRAEIVTILADYKEEYGRLTRRERRSGSSLDRYDRDIVMPCLFNAGCAVGKKGITALEIENGRISLVYWFEQGKSRRYLGPEVRKAAPLAGTPYRRAVLNSDRLDYLFARIDLLA